jgi:hypothetical protein
MQAKVLSFLIEMEGGTTQQQSRELTSMLYSNPAMQAGACKSQEARRPE